MKNQQPTKFGMMWGMIFFLSLSFPQISEAGTYLVKRGDCLWKIARMHRTSVQELQKLNKIKGTLIHPGQILKVPDPLNHQKTNQTAAERINPVSRQQSHPARKEDSDVITTARRFIGIPYRYGGACPETGFDCSGFVQYVFSLHGIKLPRTASSQAATGIQVADLAPGDLVFFSTEKTGLIDHVGIYMGNNAFIHASRSKGITITPLQDTWYGPRYAFARRLL